MSDLTSARIDLLRQALAKRPDAAALRVQLAEALWQAGRPGEFAEGARRASLLDGSLVPADGTRIARELRGSSLALIEHGAAFASVIADLAVAEAYLGDTNAVRRLMDFARFFHGAAASPPDGVSATDFHAALAAEIKADLTFYEAPDDRALRRGWQFNGVARATPVMSALRAMLRREVERYISALPDDPGHPFVQSRPAAYTIDGWANVSDGATHHYAHIHPRAWLTGVYYVVEPEVARAPGSHAGWLRVAPPLDETAARSQGWSARWVRPAPGTLVLMPGYFYHGTAPMGVDQERICVAFNVTPAA
ncbi:MAG TPA: putative 2OG-Fe(II) oxygenase [Rhizomicrobium sp.]|jgi:hypothetical protein|nr:putative 2OG-Fe(II) oxygenase [Rhizomicrobium sp.]